MGTRLKSRIKTRPLLTTPSVGTIELHLSADTFICIYPLTLNYL